jgi:CRISPR-associated protein Csh2
MQNQTALDFSSDAPAKFQLPIMQNPNNIEKSEILFLYESSYSVPNGDPFTGEQRYDEETKKILVSDVRIKRFIRDWLAHDERNSIYVLNEAPIKGASENADPESGAAARFNAVLKKLGGNATSIAVLQSLIDVRLFGGISTKKGDAINLTGPVQFALLNPSLNSVDLRMHQNTSVFVSKSTNTRGAIGTTTVVPYALCLIHGWVNPYAAAHTALKSEDLKQMYAALWHSINNANTRSKSNQNSLLMLQVIYAGENDKIYGLERKIKLQNHGDKRDEQLRSRDDWELDLSGLQNAAQSPKVKEIRFYSEDDDLNTQIAALGDKFRALESL